MLVQNATATGESTQVESELVQLLVEIDASISPNTDRN